MSFVDGSVCIYATGVFGHPLGLLGSRFTKRLIMLEKELVQSSATITPAHSILSRCFCSFIFFLFCPHYSLSHTNELKLKVRRKQKQPTALALTIGKTKNGKEAAAIKTEWGEGKGMAQLLVAPSLRVSFLEPPEKTPRDRL